MKSNNSWYHVTLQRLGLTRIIVIGLVLAIGVGVLLFLFSLDGQNANTVGTSTPSVAKNTVTPAVKLTVTTNSPTSIISPLISPVLSENSSIVIRPRDYVPAYEAGEDAYFRGDYQTAIESFTEAIKFNPQNSIIYNLRGSSYQIVGDLEKAVIDYTNAISINAELPDPFYNRGRVYSQLGENDKALDDLNRAIEINPGLFGYRANGNIGLIHLNQGEFDKAIEAFENSIAFDDTKADVYLFKGETYSAMGNYDAAIADYQAAIERFTDYDIAYQSLGYAQYKSGLYDEATGTLNQALFISPDMPFAHFYLTLVYLSQDKTDDAETEISEAIVLLNTLSEEEQTFILTRVLADLKSFAQANPDKVDQIDTLIGLMPQP